MSLKSKIKGMLHAILMMAKEEKVQPIIVPTDKEKLLEGKVALIWKRPYPNWGGQQEVF